MIHLEHRCTSKREGVQTLLRALAVMAIMMTIASVVYAWTRRSDPSLFSSLALAAVWLFALAFVGLAVWYAVVNIRTGGEFVVRIDDIAIECRIPLAMAGQSFKLPIKDIVKVEHDMRDDNPRWYLHDKSGRRYLLTPNYDNPILDIIELLERLNPAIIEEQTRT